MSLLILMLFLWGSSAQSSPKSIKSDYEKVMYSNYIKSGESEKAQADSLVIGLTADNITSYSGFFTVNKQCDSNLFVWFFPSQNNPAEDPITLWLQGGPGATTFFGILAELGPYNLKLDGNLELRDFSWNRNSSIIFVDSPVGTGFSYTSKDWCFATEETQIGTELLSALDQFFVIFPEYKNNDFFIAGTSYAGHYIPALAYAMHISKSSINLKGIAIGNGWVDPENQLVYSDLLYQLGIVDGAVRHNLAEHEEIIGAHIKKGMYKAATDKWHELLEVIYKASGYTQIYNFIYPNGKPEGDIDKFVVRNDVRKALHVGRTRWNEWNGTNTLVYEKLKEDISQSVRPWLEVLLDHYRVLIYCGQLDLIASYSSNVNYISKLRWTSAEEYHNAQRKLWFVGDSLAGYAKVAGNLTEVLVRNAGHIVPEDQPEWAFDMFNKFIFNKPFAG